LLHELNHTKVMAHNKLFWSKLSNELPDIKDRRKELRQFRPTIIVTL